MNICLAAWWPNFWEKWLKASNITVAWFDINKIFCNLKNNFIPGPFAPWLRWISGLTLRGGQVLLRLLYKQRLHQGEGNLPPPQGWPQSSKMPESWGCTWEKCTRGNSPIFVQTVAKASLPPSLSGFTLSPNTRRLCRETRSWKHAKECTLHIALRHQTLQAFGRRNITEIYGKQVNGREDWSKPCDCYTL